jgi:hypothetical protein
MKNAVVFWFSLLAAFAQQGGDAGVPPQLRAIAAAGQLAELRWPDFSDYRAHVQNFYQPAGYAPAWIREGRPTAQALAIIGILKQADSQGLDPEDYDGSRWDGRLARLQTPHPSGDGGIFDAALTVCLMRYISTSSSDSAWKPRSTTCRLSCANGWSVARI